MRVTGYSAIKPIWSFSLTVVALALQCSGHQIKNLRYTGFRKARDTKLKKNKVVEPRSGNRKYQTYLPVIYRNSSCLLRPSKKERMYESDVFRETEI